MTNPFNGRPALVQSNLPGTFPIASTTNATPIVATTTGSHGMSPGDYFCIYSATDPSANGLFMAGTCTATTVVLLVISTGANSVGTMVGGAVGTLAPAGYAVEVPLLSDADPPSAALWNVPYEAALDRVAWLLFLTSYRQIIKAGGTFFIQALGTINAAVGSAMAGVWDFVPGSIAKLRGRRALGLPVAIAAGNVTIDVSQGSIRTITAAGAAASTIVLDSTTHVPEDGEIIEVYWRVNANNASVVMSFTRDAGHASTPICSMVPSAVLDDYMIHARFQCISGLWHLGPASLRVNDGTSDYGVLADTGA